MNFLLGGVFNSCINLNFWEDKGFIYGVNSGFVGGKIFGWFEVSIDFIVVNIGEGIVEILKEINCYCIEGVIEEEIVFMCNVFMLSDVFEFEIFISKVCFLR